MYHNFHFVPQHVARKIPLYTGQNTFWCIAPTEILCVLYCHLVDIVCHISGHLSRKFVGARYYNRSHSLYLYEKKNSQVIYNQGARPGKESFDLTPDPFLSDIMERHQMGAKEIWAD